MLNWISGNSPRSSFWSSWERSPWELAPTRGDCLWKLSGTMNISRHTLASSNLVIFSEIVLFDDKFCTVCTAKVVFSWDTGRGWIWCWRGWTAGFSGRKNHWEAPHTCLVKPRQRNIFKVEILKELWDYFLHICFFIDQITTSSSLLASVCKMFRYG